MRHQGKWLTEGELLKPQAEAALRKWQKNKWARPAYLMTLLRQMVRFYGAVPVMRRLSTLNGRWLKCTTPSHRFKLKVFENRDDLLQITLKSWPNPKHYLESEKHKCSTLFVSQNECAPFCLRNINQQHPRSNNPWT